MAKTSSYNVKKLPQIILCPPPPLFSMTKTFCAPPIFIGVKLHMPPPPLPFCSPPSPWLVTSPLLVRVDCMKHQRLYIFYASWSWHFLFYLPGRACFSSSVGMETRFHTGTISVPPVGVASEAVAADICRRECEQLVFCVGFDVIENMNYCPYTEIRPAKNLYFTLYLRSCWVGLRKFDIINLSQSTWDYLGLIRQG